ncbi:MAG: hypothetical protein NT038_04715 [Euryarchaeota archaeon]|nr:hypothetical protein [Euryarchaeota archaeon]
MQAYGYYTGDIIFQKDGQKLWRMFEDENGLYLEQVKSGKTYQFVLTEQQTPETDLTQTVKSLQEQNKLLEERITALEQSMGQGK